MTPKPDSTIAPLPITITPPLPLPRYAAYAPDAGPAIQFIIESLVLPSLPSAATRRMYRTHLRQFTEYMLSGNLAFQRSTVQSWIASKREAGRASSSINQGLAAVKKLAYEARYAPSQALPDEVYRGIEDIPSEKAQGRKTGKWMTIDQVTQLLHSIPTDLTGCRDRALLAVMIGCALRRDELLKLTPAQIQQREGRWVFADVLGKGAKYRTVPIPSGVKARLDEWLEYAGVPPFDSPLFVPIRRGGMMVEEQSPRLSDSALTYIVRTRCEKAGLGRMAPHDLRRTFARIARKNKQDLDQIQAVLGHSSVSTTQVYVGGIQELARTPGDSFETDWGEKT